MNFRFSGLVSSEISARQICNLLENLNPKPLGCGFLELDKDKNIFVMCHTGTRSQAVCKWLKAQGYNNCVNVLGGIDAWAALIDRNIRRY